MKIRGKIFSIVGLMGLISLLISAMAGYALVEYNARLDAFDNASYQAQLGERLNRNVTAVVMDSRGIYASDTTDEATKFATGLMANLDAVDATLEEWRPLILAEQMPAFESLIERTAEFRNFRSETARLGRDVDPALANEQGNNEANRANRKAYQAEIDAFTDGNVERLLAVKGDLDAFRQSMMLMIGITAVLGLVVGVSGAAYLGTAQLSRPIRQLTETMTAYAHGDFSAEVSYAGRKDEIGEIARAVEVFRDNGIKVAQMTEEEQARAQRTLTRAQTMEKFQGEFGDVVDVALRGDFSRRIDSRFDDEDISRIAGSFNRLIASVDGGLQDAGSVLSALADSDLNREMTGDHKGAFRELQLNVNRVSETLRDTVLKLRDTSRALKTATGEILSGANDLSERTTKQAATIEETSAAMENIAATVLENVKEAQDASEGAENVRVTAETGGQVMQQATEAMERITNSSAKISNIIGMIDDIAFQTNL
ncbi:methyl-accepting chemotaxis protein, partial [Cucumibacter marinus]|uniref:methyl-accepting chemotaxis protein n=1 Tax=Cucumibacter marinus TaxID=1121252 RepID=UPI0004908E40